MDFLNTRMRAGDGLADLLQNDRDVFLWLKQAGFPVQVTRGSLTTSSLLSSTRKLRESIRLLIERRKAGRRGELFILNRFLGATRSYSQFAWGKSKSPVIKRVILAETRDSILTPLAEAAADLLVSANFDLVKRCENEACVLWFLDQTKSHRRRWCSMEICGNRYKVAAYRNRVRDRT